MLRRLGFLLAMASLFMMASAQIYISPTGDTGQEDLIVRDSDNGEAQVDQKVVLNLPQMTAIHLNAPEIVFDLTGDNWAEGLTCVTSTGPDVPYPAAFHGQTQTVPGGIAYRADDWNQIRLIYLGNSDPDNGVQDEANVPVTRIATKYAPAEFEGGRLVEGSKDYFVCYQTFIMQLFSNAERWSLTVDRQDTTDQGIEHLYIQANTCAHFGQGTGLYALPDETEDLNLLPTEMTNGTTGALALTPRNEDAETGGACDTNKSWLDILGVLAVKVNSDRFGENVANLTYTLTSHFPE